MRLSDIKGERALDALAEIIDPVVEILQDKEVATALRNGNNLYAVKSMIKSHKKEVIKVLAILDGEDPTTYSPSILSLPVKLLEILNDPDMQILFQSQGQSNTDTSFGSATENTEE